MHVQDFLGLQIWIANPAIKIELQSSKLDFNPDCGLHAIQSITTMPLGMKLCVVNCVFYDDFLHVIIIVNSQYLTRQLDDSEVEAGNNDNTEGLLVIF